MGRIYFAFGSNMNREQMARRCPKAELLGVGMLPQHRLCFSGHSMLWGGAVANVVRDVEAEVAGALWWLENQDIERLDGFEGHPWAYQRCTRLVTDEEGRRRRAQVYFKAHPEPSSRPTWAYLRTIWQGYEDFGLDAQPLLRAARMQEIIEMMEME